MVTPSGTISSPHLCPPSNATTTRPSCRLPSEKSPSTSKRTTLGPEKRSFIYIPFRLTYQSPLGKPQGLKTWFEASILKSDDPEATSYNADCHPHTWFTSLSGGRPKLLNEILVQEDVSEPQPNPFDQKKKRWTVTNDIPTDDKWQEISWAQGQGGNGSDFVDSLTIGDRIVLIVRAQVCTAILSYRSFNDNLFLDTWLAHNRFQRQNRNLLFFTFFVEPHP